MLREKIFDIILRYEVLGGNVKKILKNNEYNAHDKFSECYDMEIVKRKNEIEKLSLEYQNALLKYAHLMDKWNKLKYEELSLGYLEKSKPLLLQAQVAELQAKIIKLSCITKMFKETPTTINAFKILNQIVDKKLKAITNEICEKENLKKLYENSKNTEYEVVLKNYLELCKAIKKKKQILNKLK